MVSGVSSAYFLSCTSCVLMDIPFIDPYCLRSTWSLAMSVIQSQMNFSRHFAKTGVREIGRKSLWKRRWSYFGSCRRISIGCTVPSRGYC